MGRPFFSLPTTTAAYCSAAWPSKGSSRPRKSSLISTSIVSASAALRRPPGRRATPYSNSAAVIAVVATSAAGSESSQVTTPGSGSMRASSEMTFVSRMITRRGAHPVAPRVAARCAQEGQGLRRPGRRTAREYDSRGRSSASGRPGVRRGCPALRLPSIVRAVRQGHGAGRVSPHQDRGSSTSPSSTLLTQAMLTMLSLHHQVRAPKRPTRTPSARFKPSWPVAIMFAIAFGLSMDYEVFLLTRVREMWARTHGNHTAAGGHVAGPNGAGKTTTPRMLTTLLPVDGGTATVAGLDVRWQIGRVRWHIGYVSRLGGADELATGRGD